MNPVPVISASRRTDLPWGYPDFLAQRLERLRSRSVVVLWTKHPANIYQHGRLREALSRHYAAALITITGMGGSKLEPGVPPWEQVAEATARLIQVWGRPEAVRIRFDPIVYLDDGSSNLTMSPQIVRAAAQIGVKRLITSFVSLYPQVRLGLAEQGLNIIEPPLSRKLADLRWLAEEARRWGVTLQTCSSLSIPECPPGACIDGEWLAALFGIALDTTKDASQRKSCLCIKSRDIGSYRQLCPGGCPYCYAQKGGTVSYLRRRRV